MAKKKSSPKSKKSESKKVKVARGKKITRKREKKLEKMPGGSNTGRYKRVKKKDFAGAAGGSSPYSFPINTLKRARNALARAHFAPNPAGIRRAVYKKYPQLRPLKKERE